MEGESLILSATAQIVPNLLQAIALLSDKTVRKSTVDQEDLKPFWKSEKNYISLGDQQDCYLQVFPKFY